MSSPEYDDNVYESQENLFEKNTGSDVKELNDLIGNLYLHCFEKDASESGSGSDKNEDKNVSLKNVDINRAGYKDWCICGCCKKKIREIDC